MSAPELDFDELDKAISGVLSDKDVQKEVEGMTTSQPPASNFHTTPQVSRENESEPSKPAKAVSDESANSSSTPTTARERVQGRPSAAPAPVVSARKPISKVSTPAVRRGVIDIMSPPSQRPSRQGNAVKPMNDVASSPATKPSSVPTAKTSAPTPAPEPVSPAERALRWPPKQPEDTPEPKATAGQVQEASHKAFETPKPEVASAASIPHPSVSHENDFERFDTLSHSGFDFDDDSENQPPAPAHHDDAAKSQILTEKPDEKPSGTPEPSDDVSTPSTPATSPFLSGTKVEKRPLGGYGAPTPAEPASTAPEKETRTELTKSMPADPLLEDHYDDIDTPATVEPEKPIVAEAIPENADTGVKLDHLLDDGEPETAKPSPTPTNQFSSMQSIPQQYKIKDQKADDTPRPVFDTNEYHTPLHATEPEKHRGIGVWIFLAVIILLAIAGGVFIYLYGAQIGL